MFGVLPKDSLTDLMQTAKYGLNPQLTTHIQKTIDSLGEEGKNEKL